MAKGKSSLGKNIECSVEGSKMTLVIDLSKDFGPSASGKTVIIASSEGNKEVGDVRVGVNVYKYPDAKPAKAKK
jgi:hypothetical protein